MTSRYICKLARWTGVVAATIPLAIVGAWAQTLGVPPFDIWAVQLGQPITQIPFRQIAFAACGTNGGPPSTILNTLEDYSTCRPEDSGLREVFFEYDDEQAYIARAHRVEFEAMTAATTMYGHPIIPSVLTDNDGIVRGIRVVTDNRTTEDLRAMAVRLAVNLQDQFSSWALDCQHLQPAEGETAVGKKSSMTCAPGRISPSASAW